MDAKTSAAPTSSTVFVRVVTTMSRDAAPTSASASAISSRNEKATIRNTTIATGPPSAASVGSWNSVSKSAGCHSSTRAARPPTRMSRQEVEAAHHEAEGQDRHGAADEQEQLLVYAEPGLAQVADEDQGEREHQREGHRLGGHEPERAAGEGAVHPRGPRHAPVIPAAGASRNRR